MLTLYHKMSALWNCHFCTKIAFYGPLCLFEMWRPLGTKLYWILWFFLVLVLLCHQIGQDDHFPGCWCLLRKSDDLLEVTKGTLTSSSENRTWWNSPTNTILIKSILDRADCPQRHFHPMPCMMPRTLIFSKKQNKTEGRSSEIMATMKGQCLILIEISLNCKMALRVGKVTKMWTDCLTQEKYL